MGSPRLVESDFVPLIQLIMDGYLLEGAATRLGISSKAGSLRLRKLGIKCSTVRKLGKSDPTVFRDLFHAVCEIKLGAERKQAA